MVKNPSNQTVNNICDLPIEILELIISYISYDEISKIRAVCRLFDGCSQRLLNRGFVKVEKYHAICFKKVKAQLPRRESERRSHPLARHCDVLSAIETRLSLLGMTYMKYVELSLCCFIPGKVIDEIYRVLRFIQNNPNPPRVHELLQELRDISSMAMEYFEEKIAPQLKSRLTASSSALANVAVPISSSSMSRALPSTSSGSPLFAAAQRMNSYSEPENKSNCLLKQMQTSQNTIKKELNEIKIKFKEFSTLKREITSLKARIKDNEKIGLEKDQTIAELKAELEDLKRRMTELDKKSGLKTIKDEQHLQKESKASKRKSLKSTKTPPKRARNQSIDYQIEDIQPMDISTVQTNGKRRSLRSSATKPQTIRSDIMDTPVKTAPKKRVQSMTKRKEKSQSVIGKREKRLKTK